MLTDSNFKCKKIKVNIVKGNHVFDWINGVKRIFMLIKCFFMVLNNAICKFIALEVCSN